MRFKIFGIRNKVVNVIQARKYCSPRPVGLKFRSRPAMFSRRVRARVLKLRSSSYDRWTRSKLESYWSDYIKPRCDAHMNELPVPCVPWNPWYKDKQSLYSKILVLGAVWWVFSFGMMFWTNSIYFNWKPPRQPAPPLDMVEECEDE